MWSARCIKGTSVPRARSKIAKHFLQRKPTAAVAISLLVSPNSLSRNPTKPNLIPPSSPSGFSVSEQARLNAGSDKIRNSPRPGIVMPSRTKMTSALGGFIRRTTGISVFSNGEGIKTASEGNLFEKCDPEEDGDDCLHDCETCTVKYPAKFSIDENAHLYGGVNGWSTHLLVATGKTDWVRSVKDEKGSVMEAVGKAQEPSNGKLMLSASNIPVPHHDPDPYAEPTRCLLLPAFTWIDNVSPSTVPSLISHISQAPTNTTPLLAAPASISIPKGPEEPNGANQSIISNKHTHTPSPSAPLNFTPCTHRALILLCSQRTRDARCGQSAPLLKRELERHLRAQGLYRDAHDTRPGGVGVYFISHVGGHKFSANVMVYRRALGGDAGQQGGDRNGNGVLSGTSQNGKNGTANTGQGLGHAGEKHVAADLGAEQCIWLARVRPEDCENIVRYTVLKGKVVKPERQLRGGFDRGKGLVSW